MLFWLSAPQKSEHSSENEEDQVVPKNKGGGKNIFKSDYMEPKQIHHVNGEKWGILADRSIVLEVWGSSNCEEKNFLQCSR